MASDRWHKRSFRDSLSHFRDAESYFVSALKNNSCLTAHHAWSGMKYHLGSMRSERDAMLDSPEEAAMQRDIEMAARVLDRITEKMTTCVKAI